MADLKPLGSEKLQGIDKLKRIMEIARFRETIPNSINETSKSEYSLTLADGNEYQIVKEKVGYIIKKTISESTTDYIAPMQDRTYFKSYSQALKKLNLMAREMNANYNNEEGTELFSEQKKYVLKTPEKKNISITDDIENVPAPSPAPTTPSLDMPQEPMTDTTPMGGEELPTGDETVPMGDTDSMDTDMMDDRTTPSIGGEDGVVSFKTVQKLTGKLGQKLRTLNSKEDSKMSSKDIKYVINSIISALDLDNLSDEDREDILNKFEGVEAEEGMSTEEPTDEFDTEVDVDAEMGGDETGMEDETTNTEIGEEFDGSMTSEYDDNDDDTHIGHIADSIFVESKIDNILSKYFVVTENEKKFNSEIKNERKKIKNSEVRFEVKRLSESTKQELTTMKLLSENSNSKLVGKTNKKNLVVEVNNKQYKISPLGKLI
jgi:hypothetical protein